MRVVGVFSEQVDARGRLDEQELEEAFTKLAASLSEQEQVPIRFEVDEAAAIDEACATILADYGLKPASVPENVRDVTERLELALRPTGVMTRPVRLADKWWYSVTGSYLGRLKQGPPVAVLPAGIRGYAYVDPVTGTRVYVNKRTAQDLEEEALCFYRPLPQGEMELKDAVKFVLRSLGVFDYAAIVIATLVATLAGMTPTFGTKLLFGTVIPSGEAALILPLACLLLGMVISQTLFKLASSLLNARISGKLKLQTEAAVYARIMLLDASFFKDRSPGSVTSRILGIPLLTNALSKAVFELGLTGIMSLLFLLQILLYAPALAMPALVTLLLEIAIAVVAMHLIEKRNSREVKADARLSGVTPEILRGIGKIKLTGAESRAFAYWADRYADASAAKYSRPALLLAAPATIPLVSMAGTIVMYGIASGAGVAVDDFMAFNYAFGAASGALSALVAGIPAIAQVRPRLEMLRPILRAAPETFGNKRQVNSVDGSIEVRGLSFRYGSDLPYVLDGVSLSVKPGEYVAIVGRTGCGKSTLMRLLLGFEQATKGSIHYGQYDLASVDARSIRRNIGVVMQDGKLFAGDLFANITVANPRATLEDAWEAAELAGVADDIRAMPMGMHTLVGANGGGFSGGQRQRLLIARAVCGKPSILMFDEATSALDNLVQKHVTDALADLDCTRIVIAHRLSTIREADRIIMLDEGRIAEQGSYDELMSKGGRFAQLVARQQVD